MDEPRMCRIPVKACMRWNEEQGRFVIVPEESEIVDIPADVVAKYIVDNFKRVSHLVGKRPWIKKEEK